MSIVLFESFQEMLHPPGLTRLLGKPIHRVERAPFDVPHMSGNRLERVTAWEGAHAHALVLKRFDADRDWVMRLTHDTQVREVALYRHGIYARLPDAVLVPILAAARDGEAWATLMLDISDALPPAAAPIVSSEDAHVWLQQLAHLHLKFQNDPALALPGLGLSSLYDFVTILSPARVQAELDAGRTHPVMELAARGWREFYTAAPPDVRSIVQSIQQDPTALLDALGQLPQTLVHGDYKLPNLGIYPDAPARVVVLDWQDAARGPGVLDLGYFLALNGGRLPFSLDKAIQIYSRALAGGGVTVSPREIELGLAAGGALRLLWLMVTNGQSDLAWWYDLLRRVAVQVHSNK